MPLQEVHMARFLFILGLSLALALAAGTTFSQASSGPFPPLVLLSVD